MFWAGYIIRQKGYKKQFSIYSLTQACFSGIQLENIKKITESNIWVLFAGLN